MSYVGYSGVTNLKGLMAYLFFGKGKGASKRRQEGKSRTVADFCSTNLRSFIQQGINIQVTKGLKLSAISIIQSFDNKTDGFDYKSKTDQRYVNSLGRELAHKLYPHSMSSVETHNDGKHHELHNHIVIINNDSETGHAISTLLLKDIRQANNELMKQHGLSIIQPKPKDWVIKTYRTKQNEEQHGEEWLDDNDFHTIIQHRINFILSLKPKTLDELTQLLDFSGVTTKEKKYSNGIGLSYHMFDNDHVTKSGKRKPRDRQVKASNLGTKYMLKGLQMAFDDAQKHPSQYSFVEKKILIFAKYTRAINPAQQKSLKVLQDQANAIIKAHSEPKLKPKMKHRETVKKPQTKPQEPKTATLDATLTAAEREQIQQQRKLFVELELDDRKRKLKAKLQKQLDALDRAYKKKANAIDDEQLKTGTSYWNNYVKKVWTEPQYSKHMEKMTNDANDNKQKIAGERDTAKDKARKAYADEVKKAKMRLEAQAQHKITKVDPDFLKRMKAKHKNYMEKSLADDKRKQKKHKKRQKQQHEKKEERDFNKDGIDDNLEEVTTQAINDDIKQNDPYLNQFTTGFNNQTVKTSTKINKAPAKPKTQPTQPKPKKAPKHVASDDNTLQQAWFDQNLTAPTEPTAPNYSNPQF